MWSTYLQCEKTLSPPNLFLLQSAALIKGSSEDDELDRSVAVEPEENMVVEDDDEDIAWRFWINILKNIQ